MTDLPAHPDSAYPGPRPAASVYDCELVSQLLDVVWPQGHPGTVWPASRLVALTHIGLCVAGVFTDDSCAGAAVGLLGVEDGLCSARLDCLAVDPSWRNNGLSRGLFEQFRLWALSTPAVQATWTFDPTVANNAHLYLNSFSARAVEYIPACYGHSSAGDPYDRLRVVLPLKDSPAPSLPAVSHTVQVPGDLHTWPDPDCRVERRRIRSQLQQLMGSGARIVGFDCQTGYLLEDPTV